MTLPILQNLWLLNGWWWMARCLWVDGQSTRWTEVGVRMEQGQSIDAVGDLAWFEEVTEDWDVYWCPHPTIQPVRRQRYVEYGDLVGADVDAAMTLGDLDTLKPRPTDCVQTSPGRFQVLYRLSEGVDFHTLQALSRGVATITNADAGSSSIPKFFRLPNTWNHKRPGEKHPVELMWENGPIWDPDELPHISPAEWKVTDPNLGEVETATPAEAYELVSFAAEQLGLVKGTQLKECWAAAVVDDRSKVGWKMARLLAEGGLGMDEMFKVYWAWKWNKWANQPEGKTYVWREVTNAWMKGRSDGTTQS